MSQNANIEAIYPLSPMQEGMLFHSLYAPQSGAYFEQFSCRLEGPLDVPAFQRAFQRLLERQPMLRTLVLWEDRKKPLQVVRRQVTLPWAEHDWRMVPAAEQATRLEAFLQADRAQGFALNTAPLMRVTLIRLSNTAYQWVWSLHHLLIDGWSYSLLFAELFTLYAAFCRGEEPRLESSRPYRDYITWLGKQNTAQMAAFWRQQLQDFTTPTPLDFIPTAKTGHAMGQMADYTHQKFVLAPEHTKALQRLTREHKLTPNTLLQGAWGLLLSRYSGQPSVVFGATVSGRPPDLSGAEKIVGLFINTLPVRVTVQPEADLVTWLRQLQTQQLEARQYEHSSLVEVQGFSGVPRGTPLFETLLVFENYPADSGWEQNLNIKIEATTAVERTNYPLTIVASLDDNEFAFKIAYDRQQIPAATIQRLGGHLAQLLANMITAPTQKVAALSLLTPAERHQLLVEWNQTTTDYPAQASVAALFEEQVARTPEAIAVMVPAIEAGQASLTLTYAALNTRANQLANHLRTLGIGRGTLVPICVERSLDMVVGILGILKAGGAYVPLDPTYPKERLAFMLADIQAKVLLAQQALADQLPPIAGPKICLDTDWATIAQVSAANPQSGATAQDLAYIIYTSGSTGRPKGVAVPQQAINRLVFNTNFITFDANDRIAQVSNISFDAATFELWGALLHGGRLIILTKDVLLNPAIFAQQLQQHRITAMFLTVALFNQFAREVPGIFNPVKVLITGGDAVDPKWARAVLADRPPQRLQNGYGPTESTTFAAWYHIQEVAEDAHNVPIGYPLGNTQLYVLDALLAPVPVGVVGELYIGGDGLAWGYLNRPDLTAERFVPAPIGPTPGARLYKTGDRARYLPNGAVEFLGRLDNQVKLRGFRIELGEIETAIGQHPAVQEAVVLAREDEPGNKYLAAYLIPQPGTPLDVSALRTSLSEHLPEYMVPAAFVVLEGFPLTPNGKVDRRALPRPEWANQLSAEAFVGPRTPTEELLVNIWSQVLHHERLSIHHDFFELGGHSLLATQVMARIQKTWRVTLPLRLLFEAPTIAALAQHVEQARLGQLADALPPLQALPRPELLPLSFMQERLWFLDQYEPDTSVYNIPLGLRLTGPLDLAALEQSLATLGQRHESLRTTFQQTEGKPYQVIAPTLTWQLEVQDLSALPPAEREQRLQALSIAEIEQPFNLATGPLVRAKLFRLADQEHGLLITIHHIISDGWSTEVLIRELGQLYLAQVAKTPLTLPDLPLQYADFALWHRNWLQGAVLEKQLDYWRQHLAGAPALLELPTDHPRPAIQTFHGGRLRFTLPPALAQALKALSQQAEVTLFMTLLAAFQTLLYRYSGQTQLVIGSPIAGRTQVDLENLIGFFVNTLVFHTDLSGNPTFQELLARVREITLGAYTHQDVPFEKLVEVLAVERNLSYPPIFQVMFVLQNVPEAETRWGELTLQSTGVDSTIAKFDLTLTMGEDGDGLAGYWEYNSALFEVTTIERIAANFQVLLAGIVNQPQQKIAALPLLTPAERQLLVEWNRAQPVAAVPPTPCLHHLFEAQVTRNPQARAVTYKDQHLTYAELNARANQLAHHLRTLGARPDKVIGLCMERSLDLVVGILGILKAGAAYLPLDPAYPQDRLAFMVADAQVTAVITQTAFTNLLPAGKVPVINLDADWPTLATQPAADPTPWAAPENLAYIIYTSGSTGKPKGVMIYHANVVRLMSETDAWYHFNERDVWTLFHSYAFDFSVWEIWGALLYGGRLVVVPFDTSRSPDEFYQLLANEQVTVLNQTPSAFKQLITAEGALPAPAALALRYVIFGGEALEPRSLQPWYERHGDTQPTLVNMYGITETTVHVTYRPLTQADVEGAGSPVGCPIPDLQVYVLDTHLNLAPIGVPGEMYVGGAGLARGYLNRPDLTAERFVPDPFGQTPGARLYKTGDRARYAANGQLEFLGRADNQVKIRGFRIELGEVEAALSRHPDIRETVVLVREDTPGDKRLVAYLVAKTEPPPSLSELRNFLQKTLPSYMLPAAFMFMASFPQTANGKTNRKALPAPTQERPELEKHFVAPQTPSEVAVAMIWRQVLRVENIGLHDNFFDLGGHSLLATQLLARLRDTFRTTITLRELFEAPTVATLVNRLVAKEATPGQTEKIALLLQRLAKMSPEEVKKALAATRGKSSA